MDAITTFPPGQRAGARLRPRQRRSAPRWRPRSRSWPAARDRPDHDHRRRAADGAAASPIDVVQPHNHASVLGTHRRRHRRPTSRAAIDAALKAAPAWRALPFDERAAVFLRAADLLAGPWRDTLNAATMLGQSKSAQQAEIDAACELIDFLRFNVALRPPDPAPSSRSSSPGVWNRMDYRPLEGFVFAITPFNFTAIAGNLPTAPALMGNVVVWKPSPTQQFAAHFTMRLLEEAGLPPGVINMVTGDGAAVSEVALTAPGPGRHPLHRLDRDLPAPVAHGRREHRPATASYPRLVGETGGKDFVVAHPSADPDVLRTALIRGAFEYQGQKCSAASRAYVPRSLWYGGCATSSSAPTESLTDGRRHATCRNFMGAVIDDRAFAKHKAAIDRAAPTTRSTSSPAAPTTTARATSSGRRSWSRHRPDGRDLRHGVLRPDPRPCTSTTTPTTTTMLDQMERVAPYALTGAIFARGPRRDRRGAPSGCASPRATSTSTTSPPARSSASSPSAAPGPRAPTTRPARCSTCCAGRQPPDDQGDVRPADRPPLPPHGLTPHGRGLHAFTYGTPAVVMGLVGGADQDLVDGHVSGWVTAYTTAAAMSSGWSVRIDSAMLLAPWPGWPGR